MVIARTSPSSLIRWEPPSKRNPYESRAVSPQELVEARVGMIHNRQSGQNRAAEHGLHLFQDALGPDAVLRETDSRDDLQQIMRDFRAAGVNAVVVNGGDGSLAAAVTEAYYCYGEQEMPIFLPLRGGSFNAVAGNVGTPKESRLELLRWLRTALADSGFGLREKQIGTIRMHDPRLPRDVFGFILMAGIPYKLDQYIYSKGSTDEATSLYCLANMLIGGLFGTKLGKHIFSDTPARVSVDGEDCGCESFKLTMATTLHRLLPLVTPCPPPLAASQRRFSYMVNYMETREMFKRPVKLFMNKYHGDSRHLTGHARSLVLHGYHSGYSLDGELMPPSVDVDLSISTGVPVRVWVVTPPDGFSH
jgi:hypothetical protein